MDGRTPQTAEQMVAALTASIALQKAKQAATLDAVIEESRSERERIQSEMLHLLMSEVNALRKENAELRRVAA